MGDEELEAMSQIRALLEPFDESARKRVLEWVAARFDLGAPTLTAVKEDEERDDQLSDFASLFAEADPKTEPEKVLVAAYWAQVVGGNDALDSQSLNRELKNLGHGIGNVTAALTSLISRKPRLVMQVRKGGSSRQARKSYRLTLEGIKRVQQMTGKQEVGG
jgi:hypothetical protein